MEFLKELKPQRRLCSMVSCRFTNRTFDVLKIFIKSEQKLSSEICVIKGKRTNRNLVDYFFTLGMTIITFCLFRSD